MRILTAALCAVALSGLSTSLRAQDLQTVVSKMDQASRNFGGVSAKLKKVSYTAVIDDKSEETGSFRLKKDGDDVKVLIEFTAPNPRFVAFEGRKAQIFYPKINTVQEYDLGKEKELVDQFLLLGFGSSGKQLAKNYNLRFLDEQPVDGQKTSHLELVPKSKKVAEQLKKIELWIDPSSGQPLRQKFFQSGSDYTLIEYQNLKLERDIPDADVSLKLPAGVKREFPQKN